MPKAVVAEIVEVRGIHAAAGKACNQFGNGAEIAWRPVVVGIEKGDVFAARFLDAAITRRGDAAVRLREQAHARVADGAHALRPMIGRAIVHHDHLVGRVARLQH